MLMGAVLGALFIQPAVAQNNDKFDAALKVLGFSGTVPAVVSYCHQKFGNTNQIHEAGIAWVDRHRPLVLEAKRHAQGGIADVQQQILDKITQEQVIQAVDSEADGAGFCSKIADTIRQGTMDMANEPDLSEAIAVLVR